MLTYYDRYTIISREELNMEYLPSVLEALIRDVEKCLEGDPEIDINKYLYLNIAFTEMSTMPSYYMHKYEFALLEQVVGKIVENLHKQEFKYDYWEMGVGDTKHGLIKTLKLLSTMKKARLLSEKPITLVDFNRAYLNSCSSLLHINGFEECRTINEPFEDLSCPSTNKNLQTRPFISCLGNTITNTNSLFGFLRNLPSGSMVLLGIDNTTNYGELKDAYFSPSAVEFISTNLSSLFSKVGVKFYDNDKNCEIPVQHLIHTEIIPVADGMKISCQLNLHENISYSLYGKSRINPVLDSPIEIYRSLKLYNIENLIKNLGDFSVLMNEHNQHMTLLLLVKEN
jgi:uncharacterized SAM-dependent methyltransferase